ncbi:MAG: shikimate dehydrogenase, partial [Clostridium saudiense]|nr:shikimate dehydrogenase [Clostridium saudiense]
ELNSIKGYLIINTTPVGMFPNVDNSAVSKEVIKNFDVAVDLVYNPTQTKFLQFATEEGKVAIGGLHMLVGQAVKSQAIFNDREISEELINYIYDDLSKDFK